jgi:hypothetical protein
MPIDDALMAAQCCVEPRARPAGPLAGLCCARYRVEAQSPHSRAPRDPVTLMIRLPRIALSGALAMVLAGCSVPVQTTRLMDGPAPVTIRLEPAVPGAGQSAELTVTSPGADSILLRSENGLDRYAGTRGELHAHLTGDFGDSIPVERYAVRWRGKLLSRLTKPAMISVCRQGTCREIYHEIPVDLPEANHRTVALTAGYDAVFARRSLVGSHSTVLFREALSSGIWSAQGEWADHGWSARLEGFAGRGEHGASLDLSRVLKRAGEVSYGISLHLDTDRSEWLPEDESPVLADRTAWRAGIGPSLMLRGVTASSQLGIYSDGVQTLQVVSTRVRINGNLTEVRLPVSLTAEKTFAFGGGAIVSRRRDALERLVASVHLVDALAVNFGLATHRSAWPNDEPGNDFRASETLFTLGGQYSVSW